jgi:hypothetical protein
MARSVMINLDDMLFAAYTLGADKTEDSPRLTKEELRTKLLAEVPLIASANERPAKASKKTKHEQPHEQHDQAETKKPAKVAKSKAEKKPKAEPEGDVRCCARSLYEKDHLEAGKPKVMRDDEANQFGDRCKFKKVGETNFCKGHAEKQPHGVWGAEYSGKLKTLIEKMNAPVEEKPAKEPKVAKKIVKKATKPTTEESEEPNTPKKVTKPVKPTAPKRPTKEDEEDDVEDDAEDEYMPADVLEQANIEYEWVTIDEQDYMIDAEGNVYDPETEKKIGEYDAKTKKWISGGPASE